VIPLWSWCLCGKNYITSTALHENYFANFAKPLRALREIETLCEKQKLNTSIKSDCLYLIHREWAEPPSQKPIYFDDEICQELFYINF